MRIKLAAAALAMLVSTVAQAQSTVRYSFTGLTSFFGADATGSFTYDAPTFVSAITTIPTASLTSCSTTSGVACDSPVFYTDTSAFTATPSDMIAFGGGGSQAYYYFTDGALNELGTYTSIIFGDSQSATLVVSRIDATVPEPTSWMMMIGGMFVVGAGLRRRQTVRVAFS